MSMLKSVPPKHVDRITVDKIDNGYYVLADTKFAGKVGHYCSNLRGVTKALWAFFEGSLTSTKQEMEGVRGVLKTQQEKIESKGEGTNETKETEDA